ncbi:inosose dehydratase [Thermobispora bispora]|uniref:Myo-inosose-2 dehydratase n=1 Tax=Thermobispora bispora (strain ATCC 19993 / DSM 43833 / CBS 139.67 / JCM 10125 / KCTC 9307 / NBRC 14880 / R51) TaxID=469371 RepID=D6Y7R3_THEBD|nr:TIM barrel protein [Thermobispora bispora]ADG89774.1 Myo-inosose-2 dehydratase [Thermobispora bispora DSM 43833]MDI9580571.1 TIM barrel protein [Thermobispora sp.]
MRIAGAPISWGVCEVPGWGHQLDRERVLGEMRSLGLSATELGPDGFLPEPAEERDPLLARYGLQAIGGFVPVVLHDPGFDPLPGLRQRLAAFREQNLEVMVLAAATGLDGYDERPRLDAAGWDLLLGRLDRIAAEAAEAGGPLVTLHPHVGTMVETAAEVRRVLDGCAVPLCLDTGHLLIGGADPAEIAAAHPGRVAHVHLKDADAALAERVRAGRLTYTEAVRQGVYRPLGQGDVDIPRIVAGLGSAGYRGWYVMEQDVMLDADPPPGEGPIRDVAASLAYLRSVA